MTGILISGLVFCAVFFGIFAINLVITDIFKEERSKQLREMESSLRVQMRRHARESVQEQDLHSIHVESQSERFSLVGMIKRMKRSADQAGLNMDPQKLWFGGMMLGSLSGLTLFFFTKNVLIAVLAIGFGVLIPIYFIYSRRAKRMHQLAEQLPDALELMARVLRAGQTVTQAMDAVADEFADPIGPEFGFCYEQQNLGLSLEVAMRNMVERTGLMEIKILVMGMLIQRQAGGNLAELLDKLADVMRQRDELNGMVRSFTAEGRLQAGFLVALPFFTYMLMLFFNYGYAVKLLAHPVLIYTTIGFMCAGMVWIRKIINFDY